MKKFGILVVAIAALAMASNAASAANVWWQLSGDAGSNSAGNALTISVPEGDSNSSIAIDMVIELVAGDPNRLAGHASNLVGEGGNGNLVGSGITSSNFNNALAAQYPATLGGTSGGLNPAIPGVLLNFGAGAGPADAALVGPQTTVAGGVTLDINLTGAVAGDQYDINQVIGASGWGNTADGNPDVSFGFQGRVISIVVVPEPATLSLLGLGAVALIRRRR